eukprot:6718935-Pyramimonas_sp.AAC.1
MLKHSPGFTHQHFCGPGHRILLQQAVEPSWSRLGKSAVPVGAAGVVVGGASAGMWACTTARFRFWAPVVNTIALVVPSAVVVEGAGGAGSVRTAAAETAEGAGAAEWMEGSME